MPPSLLPEGWGGVSIIILISSALSGCNAVQVYSYFSRFKKDPLALKCAVAVAWLGSLLICALGCWIVHSVSVLGYDLPSSSYSTAVLLGFSIAVGLEIIVHSIVQGTYIYRIYRFGHIRCILACSCMLMLLELGFGFTWVGQAATNGSLVQRPEGRSNRITRMALTSFFAISALMDVFITVSVTYQLMRSRSDGLKRTKSLIDRIIRWTIPTGMLTSSVAIAIMLMWNIKPASFIWAGLCAFETSCYAAGLLALLNARKTQLNATDSGQLSMSLPRTTFLVASRPAGASSGSNAATATATMVRKLSAMPHKVAQVARQAESQGMDIYPNQSTFPFSS